MTDSDLDALAMQFLDSAYADYNKYSEWPLDRRIEGFLLRRGLSVSPKTATHMA
ncbi:hypothetical protein BZL30_5433 [Mycobacterium kansasii]|uniref:Uncharacterized protein n=1 Tax=Mycobacterium kansasii TaxID=1768 RepID=A0A1V3X067_MYCKA|nr:hypothetical protein BZL30_5433 [Mycobacterium kansasii]